MANRNRLIEKYVQVVREDGLQTNKNVTFGVGSNTPTVTFNGPIVANGAVTFNNVLTSGGITQGTTQALTPTTGTVTLTPTSSLVTLTPTGSMTINFAAPLGAGSYLALEVVTSGTSSYVLTFGTNTKTTGTLTTGTVSAKTFMVSFISDGTNWVEEARTTAM